MRRPSPTTLHNLGFLFVLLLIATLAWQGKRTQDTLLETNESVIGSFELITVTQGLLSSLQDVETGMRGYMLTGDPAFLAPYQVGRLDLVHRRQRLRSILLQRSPRWQAWLDELDRHIATRVDSAAENIARRDQMGLEQATRRDGFMAGKQAMDTLREMLLQVESAERRQLQAESAAARSQVAHGRRLAWTGAAVVLLLSLGTMLLINRNLRARQHAMRQAQASEARVTRQKAFLRQVIDTDENLIFVCDGEGRIELCNIAFARFLGTSPDRLQGRMPEELGLKDRVTALMDGHDSVLGRLPELRRDKIPALANDGTTRWFQVIKRPLEPDGEHQRVLTVAVDVSVRRQVEQMKSEFISTVSHELRTPLTAIRGALSMMRDGMAGEVPAGARPLIDIAHKNSERLVRLINDILDIEKLDAGRIELQQQQLALRPQVEVAVEQIAPYAGEYDVTVRFVDQDDATVRVDADRFAQVMDNLLSNAIKHSPRGGEVRVGTRRDGDMVEVSVADDGVGIPESFRGRVFERFAQADSSDARRRGGTGLGLAITRSLVERFGGTIGFTTTEGVGTRFHVRLPVAAEPQPMVGARAEAAVAQTGARVLVFEREPACARSLADHLGHHGHACVVAHAGDEAWRLLEREDIHALVLGLEPDGDGGLGFLRTLRGHASYRHLPVVVASLKPCNEGGVTGGAVGIVDWLHKPMQPGLVVEAVRTALARTGEIPSVLHVEDDGDLRALVARQLQGDRLHLYPAASLAEARAQLSRRHHSLVILDLMLPDGDGAELLGELSESRPPTYVIIFSARDMPAHDNRIILRRLVKSRHDSAELASVVNGYLAAWPRTPGGDLE